MLCFNFIRPKCQSDIFCKQGFKHFSSQSPYFFDILEVQLLFLVTCGVAYLVCLLITLLYCHWKKLRVVYMGFLEGFPFRP